MKGQSDRGTGRSDGGLYYVCDGAADYRAAFISRASFVRHRLLIHAALPALLATAAMQPARAQTFIADFGYVATTGNTHLATMNFGEKLNFKAKSWGLAQQTAYVYGKTSGVASANQLKSSVRADHTFLKAVGRRRSMA